MQPSSPTPSSSLTTARRTRIVSCAVLQEFAVGNGRFHVQAAEALWLIILEAAIYANYSVKYRGKMLPASEAEKLSEKQRREECSLPLATVSARYIHLDHVLRKGPIDLYDLFMEWQSVNIIE